MAVISLVSLNGSCSGKDLNDGCRTNAGDRRRGQNVAFHQLGTAVEMVVALCSDNLQIE